MAKKLWEVHYDPEPLTAYVVAETAEDAQLHANEIDWSDIGRDYDVSVHEHSGQSFDGWKGRVPYGDSEGETCEWWAGLTAEQIAEREAAERARAEFAAHPKLLEV